MVFRSQCLINVFQDCQSLCCRLSVSHRSILIELMLTGFFFSPIVFHHLSLSLSSLRLHVLPSPCNQFIFPQFVYLQYSIALPATFLYTLLNTQIEVYFIYTNTEGRNVLFTASAAQLKLFILAAGLD